MVATRVEPDSRLLLIAGTTNLLQPITGCRFCAGRSANTDARQPGQGTDREHPQAGSCQAARTTVVNPA